LKFRLEEICTGIKASIEIPVSIQTGKSDVREFISNLSVCDLKKIIHLFQMFCSNGIVNEEKFKLERDGIYAFKSGQIRILCAHKPKVKGRIIILLNYCIKKDEKMPKGLIDNAKKLLKEILS